MALPGCSPAKETPRRRRIAAAMGRGPFLTAGQVVKSAGSGYPPPLSLSLSEHLVRIAFGDREFYDWAVNGFVR